MRKKQNMGSSNFTFCSMIFSGAMLYLGVVAEPTEDKLALLDFINNMSHLRRPNWEDSLSACSGWVGITCNLNMSRVIGVKLPGFGLYGSIPSKTLTLLPELQILDLGNNNISGPFPSELSKTQSLTTLSLQHNRFDGSLPSDFSMWENLSFLNLSNNKFSGCIPSTFSNLTHLTTLNLANNSLSGNIPDLDLPSLHLLDLSNNNLTGILPHSLTRFSASSFSGNNLSPAPIVVSSSSSLEKKLEKFSHSVVMWIMIGGCAMVSLVISVLCILICSKKEYKYLTSPNSRRKGNFHEKENFDNTNGSGNMIFFEGCIVSFDLEDLLSASAEILGKGTSGVVYRADLEDATTVVVKRLNEVSVGRKEFEQQMLVVGGMRHENVAPLRAYFYSRDEKLMVYDYYSQGSVSAMIHADHRGGRRIPLDWETRVRIAVGAARGIAHIHEQSGGKFVHGNIKSSNIFLNSTHYGCISDIGLATLITPMSSPMTQSGGYCPPEVTDTRKATQASDVFSFGVLLLELLTGRSPLHATRGDEFVHIVRWVHSVVREEWTAEVFDVELLRCPNIEEEMVEMLRIGLDCVAKTPEQRPRIGDVVKMVERVQRVKSGNLRSTERLKSTPQTPSPIAA